MKSGGISFPTVSVLMPVFNAEGSLPSTLNSLSAQVFSDWELVAVDDGCTDRSIDIISAWAESHNHSVTILRGPNAGPSAARNRASEKASGKLLAFLDADDLWYAEKLSSQVQAMQEHANWSGVGCNYRIRDMASQRTISEVHFDWSARTILRWALLESRGPALCSTLMLRASAFKGVGRFKPELRNLEDLDLALRLMPSNLIGNVDEFLCDYMIGYDQNHRNLETVRIAVLELSVSDPILSESKNRRRLLTNLQLLEAKREWLNGSRLGALMLASRAFFVAPISATRTALTRWGRG